MTTQGARIATLLLVAACVACASAQERVGDLGLPSEEVGQIDYFGQAPGSFWQPVAFDQPETHLLGDGLRLLFLVKGLETGGVACLLPDQRLLDMALTALLGGHDLVWVDLRVLEKRRLGAG